MALIKSKSTIEYIRYIPSKKIKTKLPVILKRTKKKTRIFNVLIGILIGLSFGYLIRQRVASVISCDTSPSLEPLVPSEVDGNDEGVAAEDPYRIINIHKGRSIQQSNESLLFVGVMTAHKYLSTRAAAVYETWAQDVPGRVAFFSAESSMLPETHPSLPLVKLKRVDDSYPPQKKSFLMLQYMWEHYGDSFEWFMRADDDVYVRTDKLQKLLRSVDSSKPQFIGQAGRGNQEEFGLLSLEYDENFCMGGPGILMSRSTLSKVAPHIKYCLKNLYTTHEDVELGRCVQKFAGIPCTWSYEMQTILYHNSSGKEAFTGDLKVKEVHRAMTLHPIKKHHHMYRIHNYMRGLKIHNLQHEMVYKHRDINTMLQLLGRLDQPVSQVYLAHNVPLFSQKMGSSQYLGDSHLLGKQPSLMKPPLSTIPWNFIARSIYSIANLNPRKKLESHIRGGIDDVIREVMENLNKFSRERGRVIEFKELLYGYSRENPLYGVDYILDLLLVYKKYRGRKMTVPVRKHTYLQQQFTGLEMKELPEPVASSEDQIEDEALFQWTGSQLSTNQLYDEDVLTNGRKKTKRRQKTIVNFILGLSGRFETFQRFIHNFEEVCLKKDPQVRLYIILFPSSGNDSVNKTVTLVTSLNLKYRRQHPNPPAEDRIKVVRVFDTFSRAKALEIGAAQVEHPEDLLFFIDVDILFTSSAVDRVRYNTIRGRQVYFPVVFSQYDPTLVYNTNESPNHFRISQKTGYWRIFGFGIAACYRTDLEKIGGFDTSIVGWGKEDVQLFDKFVKNMTTIFRAPDPGLIHVFHVIECDQSLDGAQYKMCVNSKSETLAGTQELADFISKNKHYFVNRMKIVDDKFR